MEYIRKNIRTARSTFLASLFVSLAITAYAQKTYRDYYKISLEAYENEDYPEFLEATRKADSLRPNHPTLLYNLAAGYALTGQPDQAFATLNYRTLFYASDDFYRDEDFFSLKDDPEFDRLRERITRYNAPLKTSDQAFEIEHAGFHPEGIAYDPGTSRFLISDIRSGKVYTYNRDGSEEQVFLDFASLGYWSAMGMQVDPAGPGRLWIATSAFPEFEGFSPGLKGKSAILEVDMKSGEIERSFSAEGSHVFGDLVVGSEGRVFVSDSFQPVIYVIEPGSKKLEPFFEHPGWWNLQGLALSGDEETLYVSDYILGIYKVELSTRTAAPLLTEENAKTRGADGIYLHDNRLVFLQNGTVPKRVGSIVLNDEGKAIPESLSYPDKALADLDEPTLGVFVGNQFYYIANSPWSHYDEDRNPNLNTWPVLKIFKLGMD